MKIIQPEPFLANILPDAVRVLGILILFSPVNRVIEARG